MLKLRSNRQMKTIMLNQYPLTKALNTSFELIALKTVQDLAGDVEADCLEWAGLQEEASLLHHVMSQLRRYQEERAASAGQKWKLPPAGQPISLFSGSSDGKSRSFIRPSDDGECSLIPKCF